MWFRVFAATDALPEPGALLAHLERQGAPVQGRFRAEPGGGWFVAELAFGTGSPVLVERFLADEEGIRAELNNWAAYLETLDYSPNAGPLMERVIQARQLFTLRGPIDHADEALLGRVCVGACTFLAGATGGFYQSDDQGFFAADGTLLVQEY